MRFQSSRENPLQAHRSGSYSIVGVWIFMLIVYSHEQSHWIVAKEGLITRESCNTLYVAGAQCIVTLWCVCVCGTHITLDSKSNHLPTLAKIMPHNYAHRVLSVTSFLVPTVP